ncbi:MAG: glutamine-hydrolyzing carbamoyl-phosphate synthase small subunit [Planctomycetales bacterium]|nr:glutamine-hydrolyzing carbamoyl-phosphate synthase small subunit [Planctomycetales bacterium]
MSGVLLLSDGSSFRGTSVGARATAVGEVCFNTSLTGYVEVLTDPSYRGQIVTMTYPLIGNYGVTAEDFEAARPALSGFVVRKLSTVRSNYRAEEDLGPWLVKLGIPALSEVDTRALTKRLRVHGALMGLLDTTGAPVEELRARLAAAPGLEGRDLASEVTCAAPYDVAAPGPDPFLPGGVPRAAESHPRVAVVDCGVKQNIVRTLARAGCAVRVFPASTTSRLLLDWKPDGLLLSNGPGDPAAVAPVIRVARDLLGKLPILGICLGHQILGLALGGKTFKLKFGHHGGNHPVKDLETGRVEITTQNHGFAVDPASLPGIVEPTHVNLNDGTCEGFRGKDSPLFAVQFHPEAAPGPHDSLGVFGRFLDEVAGASAGRGK